MSAPQQPPSAESGVNEMSPPTGDGTATGAAARLGAWVRRVADVRNPSPAATRWLLIVGAVIFIGGAFLAFRALELPPGGLRLLPVVVVAVVLVPMTVAVNAAELMALSRLMDQRLGFATAVRVVVLGTAANLLPVPGAAGLRIQTLAGGGATYTRATAINVSAAVMWVGCALVVAGASIIVLGDAGIGVITVAIGAVAAVAALLTTRRVATCATPTAALVALLLTEIATVVVNALRLVLLLAALGAGVSLAAATVVGTSGPLAAAAGVMPAGLGIAEGLAVAAGTLVAVPAAAAFAAAALNRLVGYSVLGLAAGVRALLRQQGSTTP